MHSHQNCMTRSLLTITLLFSSLAACGSKQPAPATQAPEQSPPGSTASAGSEPQASSSETAAPRTEPAPTQAASDLPATEMAAYERAKPVFDKFCGRCHAQAGGMKGALAHLDITQYPFAGHHASTVAATVRKSLGVDGGKATMPRNKPGSVTGAELDLIKAWADAFDAAHAGATHAGAGEHNHGGHGQ